MTRWSGHPAYKQVAEELRGRIVDGRIAAGARLPSLPELVAEYGVSITVIRMALAELRHAGLVVTHQGKGSFVATSMEPAAAAPELSAIRAELEALRGQVGKLAEKVAQLEVRGSG
ncbi:MAG TPA: winged helix-turn-helix domain-containing protein [Mycobacteriales bacterium]|nr:winged helix-turn-helix domain-containing protein [Mycobacteriales bacterium]